MGNGHNAAAKSGSRKSVSDQNDNGSASDENKTHGPDNNKRLGELEAGLSRLTLALQGFVPGVGEDAFGTTVRLLAELRDRQTTQKGVDEQTARLVTFLLGRSDFIAGPGEGAADGVIRLIGDLDGRIVTLTADLEQARVDIALAETSVAEAKAQAAGLAAQVDAVSGAVGAHEGFELRDGELPSEGAVRLIAELAARGKDLEVTLDEVGKAKHWLTEQLANEEKMRQAAEGKVETLTGKLKSRAAGEAEKALQALAGPPEPHPLDLTEVENYSELPAGEPLVLRFTDGGDLLAVPAARTIERCEVELSGRQGLLMVTIDFPPDAPPSFARTAWLAAGDKGVRCEVSGGLRFGAGTVGQIPAGHLIF